MARAQLTNNAIATLASGITDADTALTVAAGLGALFPVVTSYFYATIKEGANIEVVKVTARSADVFTIARAQDNTTAKAFTAAAVVSLNLTAAVLEELQEVETSFSLGNTTTAATLNAAAGAVQYATSTGATTWTLSGAAAAGKVTSITLELINGGAFAQTWPASVKWDDGMAPALTAAGLDILLFYTRDGGTIWRGFLTAKDSK